MHNILDPTNNKGIQEGLHHSSDVSKTSVRSLEVEFQVRRIKMNCGLHQLFMIY